MDLAHSNSSAMEIGDAGTTRAGRARFVAGILTVVAITALVATAVIAESRGNIGAATQADPLVAPAAIEFRAGERGLTSTQADPLVAPAAVEFRAGERGLTGTQADPLVGPAAIEFRAGERGLTGTQTDPLVGPAAIEFRAGEHEGAAR